MTSLIWQKTSFFNPHMTPGDKMKIPYPYCTPAYSNFRVSIVYSWKCRSSSSDKLYRKIETSFFDPNLIHQDKTKIPKPYCTSTRHTQSYTRVSFAYFMKCRQSSNNKNCTKNIIFGPIFDPWAKNENSKNLIAHLQDIPNQVLEYNFAMT